MHQGNARFQPNKPFYTQGTVAYIFVTRLSGFCSGTMEPLKRPGCGSETSGIQ